MMNPLVSVLITSYNRAQYIEMAIESVLGQSFQDFEIIISDNCSTDNTMEVLSKYINHKKIRIYKTHENIGQFPNRNYIASLALGRYLKYLDSDDTLYSECLEIMVEGMQSNPEAGIGMECKNPVLFREPGWRFFSITSEVAYLTHFQQGGLLYPGPGGCIYLKRAFDAVEGFDNSIGINADVELNMKIAAISETVLFEKEVVFWRRHSGQLTELHDDNIAMIKERFDLHQKILKDIKSPLSAKDRNRIRLMQKILYARTAVLNYLFKGRPHEFLSLLSRKRVSWYEIPTAIIPIRLIKRFWYNF